MLIYLFNNNVAIVTNNVAIVTASFLETKAIIVINGCITQCVNIIVKSTSADMKIIDEH